MKKMKVILSAAIILALAVTGCGTKNSNTVESQKETVVKTADAKKTESQSKVSQKTTEESEEIDSEEDKTIVKEDEKAAAQQTASTDGNTSDNSPSNSSSGNSNTGNAANSGNQNNSGNTASSSGNGNGGSSNSGSGSNANSSSGNSSNSNSTSTPTPAPAPQHTHTWIHVDAVGHYETVTIQAAWDETVPVYDDVAHDICNHCGADLTNFSEEDFISHQKAHALAGEGGGHHTEWRYEQTGTQTIHHDAVTEQRWIQDVSAYDVCSGCGVTK